jgi:hypothetical protein
MRKLSAFLALLLLPAILFAASGTVTQSLSSQGTSGVRILTLAWTATAGGAASADISASYLADVTGWYLFQVETYPTAGGTAPSSNYNIEILQRSADLMGATLANRSATATEVVHPTTLARLVDGTVTLSVTNAGNGGQGTLLLYFGRTASNLWQESLPSNVVRTPPVASPPGNLKINVQVTVTVSP